MQRIPTIERSDRQFGRESVAPPAAGLRLEALITPLAGFVARGTLLTLVTFGIYRFWYRTALRRYYWINTRLDGDGFDYTGTGRELFVGFLVALAIVLPFYLAVALIGFFGAQLLGQILATLVGAAILPALVQILSFRARRYRLTRTRFRGIRFHQSGSGIRYLLRTVKWLVLTALTLGIAFPYLRRALEAYKIENTWFGNAQGRFDVRIKPLMAIWLALWGVAVAALVSAGGAQISVEIGAPAAAVGLTVLVPVLLALILPLWVTYRTREFRAFVGGTSVGGLAFTSDLRAWRVIRVWLGFVFAWLALIAAIGALAVGIAVFQGLAPALGERGMDVRLLGPGVLLAVLAGGLIVFILASIVTELVLRRRLWALGIRSVSVLNLAALAEIAKGVGEEGTGIADAFDSGFDIAG